MKERLKYFLVFVPLLGGIIISLFLNFNIYKEINLPTFAPPSILFPIVWSILYLGMGIVLYRIRYNFMDLVLFLTQLLINYIWCFIFFTLKQFLFSYVVILLLDCLVIYLLYLLFRKDRISFYIMIPYLLWCIFASILNYSIFLLN
jgi:tryptophan-rich sensory protein